MVRAILGINHPRDFWKFWNLPKSWNFQIALLNMWLLVQISGVFKTASFLTTCDSKILPSDLSVLKLLQWLTFKRCLKSLNKTCNTIGALNNTYKDCGNKHMGTFPISTNWQGFWKVVVLDFRSMFTNMMSMFTKVSVIVQF